jgi:hypothetical protein
MGLVSRNLETTALEGELLSLWVTNVGRGPALVDIRKALTAIVLGERVGDVYLPSLAKLCGEQTIEIFRIGGLTAIRDSNARTRARRRYGRRHVSSAATLPALLLCPERPRSRGASRRTNRQVSPPERRQREALRSALRTQSPHPGSA